MWRGQFARRPIPGSRPRAGDLAESKKQRLAKALRGRYEEIVVREIIAAYKGEFLRCGMVIPRVLGAEIWINQS